jgi:hypothetical protein
MQDWITNHRLLFSALVVLVIAAHWCFVVYLISIMSGWRTLSHRFQAQQPFMGQKWTWQSAGMRRGARYNNCLTLGSDSMGLFLDVMRLFRPGHPPLFIPWTEITVRHQPWAPGEMVEIKLGRAEQIAFRVPGWMASRLQAMAGSYWQIDKNDPQTGFERSGPENGSAAPSTTRFIPR